MRRFLVGYDGSDSAKEAARLAGSLARRLGAGVTVLTVGRMVTTVATTVIPTVDETAFEPVVEEGAELVRALGVDVQERVVLGDPATTLVELADRERYDLVLVGHRGLGGIRELVLGSVAKKVATEAPCPALVVRGAVRDTIRTVLVGVDGSEHARRAAEAAIVLAKAFAARVTLLHVLDLTVLAVRRDAAESVLGLALEAEGQAALANVREICRRQGVACETAQAKGAPADAICNWVRLRGYDLVAVGRRGLGGLERLVLGSVSDEVIARSTCPVLVAGESASGKK